MSCVLCSKAKTACKPFDTDKACTKARVRSGGERSQRAARGKWNGGCGKEK